MGNVLKVGEVLLRMAELRGAVICVRGRLINSSPMWIVDPDRSENMDLPEGERGIDIDISGSHCFRLGFQPLGIPLPHLIAEITGRLVDRSSENPGLLTRITRFRVREETLPPALPGTIDEYGQGRAADGSIVWDQKGGDQWREMDLEKMAQDAARQAAFVADQPDRTMTEEWELMTQEERDEMIYG